jgi:hypothetical protein
MARMVVDKWAVAALRRQVNWQGCDEEGCPVLLVQAARICNDCQSAEQAQQAADAIISQARSTRLHARMLHAPSFARQPAVPLVCPLASSMALA